MDETPAFEVGHKLSDRRVRKLHRVAEAVVAENERVRAISWYDAEPEQVAAALERLAPSGYAGKRVGVGDRRSAGLLVDEVDGLAAQRDRGVGVRARARPTPARPDAAACPAWPRRGGRAAPQRRSSRRCGRR